MTLATGVLTLVDWAKRLDPDGKVPDIAELLGQSNEVLTDMAWIEGNLPTGHRTTVRTALPTVGWRQLNTGVTPSKSTTAQIDEACAILEAWSEIDVELCRLNGNTAAFRLSEAQAFIEAMNQEMADTLFYGNSGTAPEEFNGFATRYASTSGGYADNLVDGGGANGQTDCMSIWLIVWGPMTVHGIFPKGSKAGLEHNDHGETTAETSAGIGGTRMRVFQDQWIWHTGLAVRDWRYAVRIHSIDKSANNADYIDLMTKAYHRIMSFSMGRAAFYMNRTLMQRLDLLTRADLTSGGGLTDSNVSGKIVRSFRGIPIRLVDALRENETSLN